MAVIAEPVDFFGMNTYVGSERVVRTADGKLQRQHESKFGDGYPRTHFGWAVTPDALYWGTRFLHERYRLPIVIAENGMSSHDWVVADGTVPDSYRIDFLRGYLRGLGRAEAEGIPIEGYFHWTLLDNFEWAEGYKQRFGLIHVDFATQKRTPKNSAHWYANVILTNGENL
jgi:beta-glucosidase